LRRKIKRRKHRLEIVKERKKEEKEDQRRKTQIFDLEI